MGAICNQQAHFGHSGGKHSECAQFSTSGHTVDPLWRTFKMCPIFNHWVHCGQVLSVPTMYSPCAHWVYASLSPVSSVILRLRCHRYDFLVRIFGTDSLFFKLFNFYSSSEIGHKPPCSRDLCLFPFPMFMIFIHTITWPREVIIVLWSFWLWSYYSIDTPPPSLSSHWRQGPIYPVGTWWIHFGDRQHLTTMYPVIKNWVHFECSPQ